MFNDIVKFIEFIGKNDKIIYNMFFSIILAGSAVFLVYTNLRMETININQLIFILLFFSLGFLTLRVLLDYLNSTSKDRTYSLDEDAKIIDIAEELEELKALRNSDKNKIIYRINQEIHSLTSRGSLNLALGILISIVGFGILAYVLYIQFKIDDPKDFSTMEIFNFLSRLSLVIFIELFSYFFLVLYKNSLSDIKYYQNELSNFEAKFLALDIADRINDENLLKEAALVLLNTERNFILEKDQSTIEIEKEKIANSSNKNLIDTIKDLASLKK